MTGSELHWPMDWEADNWVDLEKCKKNTLKFFNIKFLKVILSEGTVNHGNTLLRKAHKLSATKCRHSHLSTRHSPHLFCDLLRKVKQIYAPFCLLFHAINCLIQRYLDYVPPFLGIWKLPLFIYLSINFLWT